jgi:hypothetical protein
MEWAEMRKSCLRGWRGEKRSIPWVGPFPIPFLLFLPPSPFPFSLLYLFVCLLAVPPEKLIRGIEKKKKELINNRVSNKLLFLYFCTNKMIKMTTFVKQFINHFLFVKKF